MRIDISLRRLRAVLVVVLVALVIAGFCAEYAKYVSKSESELIEYFTLSDEDNVPTLWSALLLFASGVVLWAIARLKGGTAGDFKKHWAALAAIFCYLAVDEMLQIHEYLDTAPGLDQFHGVFYYSWVIPGTLLVAVFAASYLRFLWHLPARTRTKVALAGVIYVGGALGIEFILGYLAETLDKVNFTWAMIDLVEESMEMIGSSLFLYALLEYLGNLAPNLQISIRSDGGATTRGTAAS